MVSIALRSSSRVYVGERVEEVFDRVSRFQFAGSVRGQRRVNHPALVWVTLIIDRPVSHEASIAVVTV